MDDDFHTHGHKKKLTRCKIKKHEKRMDIVRKAQFYHCGHLDRNT